MELRRYGSVTVRRCGSGWVRMGAINNHRQLADACLQKAITTHSVPAAEAWLRMAASWLAVAKLQQQIRHARDFLQDGLPTANAIRVPVQNK